MGTPRVDWATTPKGSTPSFYRTDAGRYLSILNGHNIWTKKKYWVRIIADRHVLRRWRFRFRGGREIYRTANVRPLRGTTLQQALLMDL